MLERVMRASAAVTGRSRWVAVAAALAVAVDLVLATGSAAAVSAPLAGSAFGQIDSISCASAGNCAAVGDVVPPSGKILFVVNEKHGIWGAAEAVPGMTALLGRHSLGAQFADVSCSSAGNCGAGGWYSPDAGVIRAFAVSEKNGIWGKAEQIPGPAAARELTQIQSVSCPSAGNCTAGGTYTPGRKNPFYNTEAFLVSQKNGVWGKAEEVPGTARLNTGRSAETTQIACTSAGNCLGAGDYAGPEGTEPFTVTEKHGTWGSARTFARLIARNTGGFAEFNSVSCPSAGSCTAAGSYEKTGNQDVVFAISQKNGTWGSITPVPGMAALRPGGIGQSAIDSLSCPSPGNCTAGGDFLDPNDPELSQPFVVTEKNGNWGSAQLLPGVAALSANTNEAGLGAVICPSAGNCSADGTYNTTPAGANEAFVSTETNGVWGTATELPGIATLNQAHLLGVTALSCGAPGNCSLGGWYYEAIRHAKPYLATQKNGDWSNAQDIKGIDP
jgi:hypothetical protein